MGALPYRRNKDVGDPLGVTISAWAAPLNHPNVTTIAAPAGVSLLGPPMVGGDLYLDAPRDAIRLDNCFLVRYFTNEGARRALVQATAVEAQPGMRDLVRGRLLAEPSEAPERESTRQAVDVAVSGRIGDDGPPVDVKVTNVSPTGVAFESSRQVDAGTRIRVAAPEADGGTAELEVVRRIPGPTIRYGGRFTNPEDGTAYARALLRADQRRREEISKARTAGVARTPKADPAQQRTGGMHTRHHDE